MSAQSGLWPEGVRYRGPPTDPLGRVLKRPLRHGLAKSLASLPELTFFTPAVLYLTGVISDQPLIDFMCEQGRDVPFYYKKFRFPIFTGLQTRGGDADWDHALWAVPTEDWPAFCDFYCSVTVHVRERGLVWRVGAQRLTIDDPLFIENQRLLTAAPPRASVCAFGLDGNRCAFALVTGPGRPTLTRLPPRLAAASFARELLAGRNPLGPEDDGAWVLLQDEVARGRKEKT